MIEPNNDSLAEMLEGTRDALEKALIKITKLELANGDLANKVLIYAHRAEAKGATMTPAETEMLTAIRAWMNCRGDRPSARALGERIAEIAAGNVPCDECGGDGHFEEVAQGSFGGWEMQRFKCRACEGKGDAILSPQGQKTQRT
jgi:hypothetical protein